MFWPSANLVSQRRKLQNNAKVRLWLARAEGGQHSRAALVKRRRASLGGSLAGELWTSSGTHTLIPAVALCDGRRRLAASLLDGQCGFGRRASRTGGDLLRGCVWVWDRLPALCAPILSAELFDSRPLLPPQSHRPSTPRPVISISVRRCVFRPAIDRWVQSQFPVGR